MFNQFGNYPEVLWRIFPAFKTIGKSDKVSTRIDLDSFRLKNFKDLRKTPQRRPGLLLTGNNDTNVFINGPNSMLDEILKDLPNYYGKSWEEINDIKITKRL